MVQESSQNQVLTGNINSFNVSIHHDNTINVNAGADDERRQILEWLSPLDTRNRHQGVSSDRLDGIGNWLLETSEFREWRSGKDVSRKAVLFCCGDPGVGKTYLSSLVIDNLFNEDGEEIFVAGLYCDFLAQSEQSPANMLGAVLKQLVGGGIPGRVQQAFRKAERELGGRCLGLADLVKLLKGTIASLPPVFICIDALDELLPRYRLELLGSLQDIIRESPGTRILLTARPHIQDEIKKFFAEAVTIPISSTKDDIKTYLEMRLDRDTEPNAMDDDLRADILRIIPESICEIFLLVSLNMDAILDEMTICQRRRKLLEMAKGKGLGDAYSTTLGRVKAQKGSRGRLGMEALMWVSHAERPLKASELCYALGVEIGSTDLDVQNIPAIKTLLGCSLGLVTVETSSSTVRLIHLTLQEYLCAGPTLFHSPRLTMAEVCLTYLNFECVRNFPLDLHQALAPFAQYASCYWGAKLRGEITESVKRLALRLLDVYDRQASSQLLLSHYLGREYGRWAKGGIFEGFTGLHCAAYFGLGELATALLEMRVWGLSATDSRGSTAIAWAASRGNEEVVKLLLEQSGVDPGLVDRECRTPLLRAAEAGHARVVKMLLGRNDVNPSTADGQGRTPLSWAAGGGYLSVIIRLLRRNEVDPDASDREGRTSLSWAAEAGHTRVVKMLLEQNDVNPNRVDDVGRSPLSWAAKRGQARTVKALLERNDVNPNTADRLGQTPLLWAVSSWYDGVLEWPLGQNDVNPDTADREGVVKMLLERNDVNPNTAGQRGQIPLLQAVMHGYEGVVKTLLERHDINPNVADQHGQTSLLQAAMYGHEGIVRTLLERSDVDPNMVGEMGRTPLSWAAIGGHAGAVKALLERGDVNPNTMDTRGRTPLLWAMKRGHEKVVMMLLERNDVNPAMVDEGGRTPLSRAMNRGHERIAAMLLERSEVNPGTVDGGGRTPLLWAASCGYEGVVKTLLKRNDVDPNTMYKGGRTPLLWAAEGGHARVVKTLLERNDINPDTADEEGRTPLSWAAERGCASVMIMLLGRDEVDPDTADRQGRTPLSWAAESGHGEFLMFLKRNRSLPSSSGGEKRAHPFLAETSGPPHPYKRVRRL